MDLASFVVIVSLVLFGYVGYTVVRMLRLIARAKTKVFIAKPYERITKNSKQHLLVLGDSTMYGAGTKDPNNTMGGLLAAKYPKASVETLAVNGAKVKDLYGQLERAAYRQYDLIVIGIGGNDIIRFSHYSEVERELAAFLKEASQVSRQIILCHCVNVGNIGFFSFPLNYLYDYRSRKLSRLYGKISTKFPAVRYVNFYRPMHDDHYDKKTRSKFIAEDAFHPSDYSNIYFFDLIWKEIQID